MSKQKPRVIPALTKARAVKEESISSLTEVATSLGDFLSGLDRASITWQTSGNGWTNDQLDQHHDALNRMESARRMLNTWLKVGALNPIVAPAGQTLVGWVADLLNRVEETWHLCRFTGMDPDTPLSDPDGERLRQDMHIRLPALHAEIRKACIHVQNVKRAKVATDGDPAGDGNTQTLPAATANDARDKWLYEQCCKLIRYSAIVRALNEKKKWAGEIDSPQGVKRAANRYAAAHSLPLIPSRQPGRRHAK